jgi:hypothetical protein
MCSKCGHFWRVEQHGPKRFVVVHDHPNGGRTELDRFNSELEAVLLANQCHHARLLEENLFGRFKECARV